MTFQKIKYFLCAFICAGLMITALQGSDVLGATEADVALESIRILMQLDCAQYNFFLDKGFYYPYDEETSERLLSTGRHQAVYWNSPSIIGSTEEIKAVLYNTYYPYQEGDPTSLMEEGIKSVFPEAQGDVRFRCRAQGGHPGSTQGNFKCMAFRCLEGGSAPCAQDWRIEHSIEPHTGGDPYPYEREDFKCTDVYLANGDTCNDDGLLFGPGWDWLIVQPTATACQGGG